MKKDRARARSAAQTYPCADADAHLTPSDFSEVIAALPAGCPMVGGQAVAWWAARYGIRARNGSKPDPITSADIDFWGDREALKKLAKNLNSQPFFPNAYEMTVWTGAVPLIIQGKRTMAEFLHTIPGLDTNDPDVSSVEQEYKTASVQKVIQVLTPVSLVLCKLHALRHFPQTHRQDRLHLDVSLQASQKFLAELLDAKEVRMVLWNCERLISTHQLKPYRRLQRENHFNILSAIPAAEIERAARNAMQTEQDRKRLENFLKLRWSRLKD